MRRDDPKHPHRPESVGDVLKSFLKESGLEHRVEQAGIVPEWGTLVGPRISQETEPLYVTADGTLFVAVRTNAWMTELQYMVPELLRALNKEGSRPDSPAPVSGEERRPIKKLRFVLRRDRKG